MTQTQNNQPRIFAFNYVLKNNKGEMIDASEPNQPLPFMEGRSQIIPTLEAEIIKLSEGDKKNISIKAGEAYGDFREDMIMEVPKEEMAHIQIEIGSHLQLQLGEGVKVVKVTKISDTYVTQIGRASCRERV